MSQSSSAPVVVAEPAESRVTPVSEAVSETLTGGDLLVEQDLLVEDISIDGMCGVY